jgi:hypothetical protein
MRNKKDDKKMSQEKFIIYKNSGTKKKCVDCSRFPQVKGFLFCFSPQPFSLSLTSATQSSISSLSFLQFFLLARFNHNQKQKKVST